MDRPSPAVERPSDEGLMTLGRGLGIEAASGGSAAAAASSSSSPAGAAAAAAASPSSRVAGSNGLVASPPLRSTSFARPTVHSPNQTASPSPATPGGGGGGTSASPSSSYQRRMPSSPLSQSLVDADGPPSSLDAVGSLSTAPIASSSTSSSPPAAAGSKGGLTPASPPSAWSASHAAASSTAGATGRPGRPMSLPPPSAHNRSKLPTQPLKSPCFVHGNLGHSVTLQDWLERRPGAGPSTSTAAAGTDAAHDHRHPLGVAPVAQAKNDETKVEVATDDKGKSVAVVEEDEDEDGGEEVESLTRQLAETAVGVREMSKQLGRTRVRSNIQSILIITKARDNRLIRLTRELAIFLMGKQRPGSGENRRGHTVYVDAQLRTSKRFDAAGIEAEHPHFFHPVHRRRSSSSASVNTLNGSGFGSDASSPGQGGEGQLRYWTSDMCARTPHLFDFVVTLGGDGTVLFTSWLFQKIVPPVLPFALGSLGFLTNFDFANYKAVMSSAIDNGIRVNLRMRFTCTVYRAIRPEDNEKGLKAVRKVGGEILMSEVGKAGWEALEGGLMHGGAGACKEGKESKREKEIMCFSTRPVETFEVLNDLVVDRGPSPFVSMLELFGDEHHMTTVQADGLTISTPTGSTAYSLSAGGSLVHPEIPAILITPICPHTLSFRPMLLPDSMELRICVPYNSRSTAWASFDGRGRVELKQGDHIKVTASQYPFPTVCADKQSTDWFQAIQRTLRWNDREKQKSFVFVEEPRNPAPKPLRPPSSESGEGGEGIDVESSGQEVATAKGETAAVGGHDAEDEDKETFDIDDSSTAAASAMNSPPRTPKSHAAVEPTFDDGVTSAQQTSDRNQSSSASSDVAADGSGEQRKPTRSGIQTPGRFADPLAQPRPGKLNIRHIVGALSTLDGTDPVAARRRGHHPPSKPPALRRRNSTPAPIRVAPRPEGEEGQRDDIHDPTAMRASKSRIPRSSERALPSGSEGPSSSGSGGPSTPATATTPVGASSFADGNAGQTPRPHERMRRHGSPRHHHSAGRSSSSRPAAATTSTLTAEPAAVDGSGTSGGSDGVSGPRAFAFYGAWGGSDSSLSESDE